MTYTAFFDLDHTILSTSSGRIIVRSLYKRGLISRGRIRRAMAMSWIYRLGLVSPNYAVARWTKWFAGMGSDVIDELSQEWANDLVKYIREPARREIQSHKKKGGRTVILSASPNFICDRMRDMLMMDEAISTELEVRNGKLTGKLSGRYCFGSEKLSRALSYCGQRGHALTSAYYYADSYSDLPLLESVGNPVCVTPDARLEQEARLRGWRIESWE